MRSLARLARVQKRPDRVGRIRVWDSDVSVRETELPGCDGMRRQSALRTYIISTGMLHAAHKFRLDGGSAVEGELSVLVFVCVYCVSLGTFVLE